MFTTRNVTIGLILALLLIATAARFHNLGTQSLWYDEGVAYGHSQRTLAEMIPMLKRNVHVPAYFGSLALYEDFVGSSEFGLRSLSAFFSILSVALAYTLGRRLFGQAAGLAAAAFTTLNTFSVYYAQEARMYALLAAVGTAAMIAFAAFWLDNKTWQTGRDAAGRNAAGRNAAERDTVGRNILRPYSQFPMFKYGLALALINAVGMYTHFSYALVMMAQGVLAVLWLLADAVQAWKKQLSWRQVVQEFIAYSAANLVTIALFLPWLGTALSQTSSQPNISDVVPLERLLATLQGWLTFGITYLDNMRGMGAVLYFLLVFGLIVMPYQGRRAWWKMLLPVLWVLVSLALYLKLDLYERYIRFLLPAQIGMALWMGRGIAGLWQLRTRRAVPPLTYLPRVAAVFATAALMVNLTNGLDLLYHAPAYQRDDYRGLAQTIAREASAQDAVIVSAPGLQEIFGYYYRGAAPVYPLPHETDIAAETTRIVSQHPRIYAVLYGAAEQDPSNSVETTLNQTAFQVSDEWWNGSDIRLVRYAAPYDFKTLTVSDAHFGPHIILAQYGVSGTDFHDEDVVQERLMWQTDAPLDVRYKVFVQLLDANGILAAQRDSEPGGGQAITTTWTPNTPITDNHALLLKSGLPAGPYTLIVGLYDLNDATQRLAVKGETALTLGTIRVK